MEAQDGFVTTATGSVMGLYFIQRTCINKNDFFKSSNWNLFTCAMQEEFNYAFVRLVKDFSTSTKYCAKVLHRCNTLYHRNHD